MSPERRLPGLDGLRGIAILLVFLYHATDPQVLTGLGATWLDRGVAAVTGAGWIGVDVFFVLSGFLITGILLDTRNRDGYFKNFYARRALRILPLYFAAVIVLGHVIPWLRSDERTGQGVGWLWVHGANYGMVLERLPDFTSHFWSLGVEEQFYVFWPIVVLVCSRRALVWSAILLVATALVWRVSIYGATGFNPTVKTFWWGYGPLWARWDSLAIGALIAVGARHRRGLILAPNSALVVALVFAVAATGLMVVTGSPRPYVGSLTGTAGYTLWAAASGALVIAAIRSSSSHPLSRLLSMRWLRYVGERSYAVYIIHNAVRNLVQSAVRPDDLTQIMVVWAVSAAGSIAMAEVSWQLLEKHAHALKRYFDRPDDAVLRALDNGVAVARVG